MSSVKRKERKKGADEAGECACGRAREKGAARTYIFDAQGSPAKRQTLSIVIIEVREERTRVIKVSGVATIAMRVKGPISRGYSWWNRYHMAYWARERRSQFRVIARLGSNLPTEG